MKQAKRSSRQLDLEIAAVVARPTRKPGRYRPAIAYPAELTQAGEHFNSGVNHPGEVRGFAMSGRSFGIAANHCSPALLAELEQWTFNGGPRLFVDSGAFSEVKFGPGGPRVVKAITDAEWRKRLALYGKLAAMYRIRCYLVAPDRVGDQSVTLDRLARYAPQIAACAAHRANIIIPVQKGAMPMSAFYAQACAILGLRAEYVIAGVPMKKDATSLAQLAELAESLPWFGARVHLLGLGPESKRFAPAIRTIKSKCPNAQITSDSVTVRRLAGRTNGPKGGPRVITRYQDEAAGAGWSGGGAKGSKAYALSKQGGDEGRRERATMKAAGWFDTELGDTFEEAWGHVEGDGSDE